jgi:hypothetical protein
MGFRRDFLAGVRSVAPVAALAFPAITHGQQATQWRVEDGGNGHWYGGVGTSRTWAQAKIHAEGLGAHLATVTSSDENTFVNSVRASLGLDRPWLGGFQNLSAPDYSEPAGGWRWVTGEPWTFTAWAGGEPNNQGGEHWLHYGSNAGLWNDLPSWSQWASLIEWSADCDGDGIVDYGEILDGTHGDSNANGVPDCCEDASDCDPCPADVNSSGAVAAEDLGAILFAWGTNGGDTPSSDVNRDGTVDGHDLSAVIGAWGPCPD